MIFIWFGEAVNSCNAGVSKKVRANLSVEVRLINIILAIKDIKTNVTSFISNGIAIVRLLYFFVRQVSSL